MIHPHTKLGFVNETIGYGVFATQFIPKGTIVWILDDLDQKLPPSYVESLDSYRRSEVTKYAYRDGDGVYVLCWDLGRYVNHSSAANTVGTAYDFDLAARDIFPGEEITCDYGCCNLDEPLHSLEATNSDRAVVTSEDILSLYKVWDQTATEALQSFNKVEQPLKSLVKAEHKSKLQGVISGEASIDSVISYYFDRNNH